MPLELLLNCVGSNLDKLSQISRKDACLCLPDNLNTLNQLCPYKSMEHTNQFCVVTTLNILINNKS